MNEPMKGLRPVYRDRYELMARRALCRQLLARTDLARGRVRAILRRVNDESGVRAARKVANVPEGRRDVGQ